MVNVWVALLACTLAAFIGYCWGRDVTYRRVARNVVRLEALVPSPRLLLRRLAAQVADVYIWADDEPPVQMGKDIEAARAPAAWIEAAGEGEE